jgi:hypothetical protein
VIEGVIDVLERIDERGWGEGEKEGNYEENIL